MVRLGTYAAASAAGAVGIIYHAFHSRGQFYPAMLYLSTSKISLVLLLNMGLVIMCSVWQLIKTLFLGSLREAEVERLNEQSWREVMEILFAITIFREEFSVSFLAMVTVLLLIKAFHWLAQKRVEYIETTPSVSRLSHFRIISFLSFLLALDCIFLYSSVSYLLKTRRPSVSLFFSFEYVILATTTISTFLKYVFYVSDMLMEGQWENKAVFTFYLELVRDLLHLSLYLFFFLVIFINYGLPLHLIRELYETFRNFKSRVADFIRYRKITSNMNDRFPDASAEELGASDATCIICREEMVAAKKLPCGHLFHVHCLRSWLERQQTCPTCRTSVIAPESGAAASGTQPDQHQRAGLEGGQTGLSGDAGLSNASGQAPGTSNNSFAQHQARLQAAAAAAAQYGSSFVYHPIASLGNWSPGNVFVNEGYASMPLPYRGGRATNSDGQENNLSMDMQMQLGMQRLLQVQSQILAAQALPTLLGCNSVYSQVPLYGLNPFHRSHAFAGTESVQDGNMQGPSSSSQSFHQTISNWSVQLELQQLWLKQRIEMLQSELQSVLQLQNSLNSIPQSKGETCNSSTEGSVQHQDVSARAASGSLDVKGKAPAGSEFKQEAALPTTPSTDSASKDSLYSDGKTESTQSSHSEIEEVQSK